MKLKISCLNLVCEINVFQGTVPRATFMTAKLTVMDTYLCR